MFYKKLRDCVDKDQNFESCKKKFTAVCLASTHTFTNVFQLYWRFRDNLEQLEELVKRLGDILKKELSLHKRLTLQLMICLTNYPVLTIFLVYIN